MALLSIRYLTPLPFTALPLNFILFLDFSFYILCGNYIILDLELELSFFASLFITDRNSRINRIQTAFKDNVYIYKPIKCQVPSFY